MSDNKNKVVKCKECNSYFTYTEKDTKCPFCHTEYEVPPKLEKKTKKK